MSTKHPVGRAQFLDLFKSLLIYGMIVTHVTQLITYRPGAEISAFADFINLITFSGFMFAFGLGIGLAGERQRSLWERLNPVPMMLAATYISEFAFVILVDRKPLNAALLTDLLSLRVLYGWSEFLASFLTLYLLIAIARPLLVRLAAHPIVLAIAIALCLGTTLVVTTQNYPLLATVIGTTNFASFPILPYLPWFLVGIWFGRQDRAPNLIEWCLAAVGTLAFSYVVYTTGQQPGRFPPTIVWVVGAALPLAVYYLAARVLARRSNLPEIFLLPGRHVLASLLLSNLIIFGVRYLVGRQLRAVWATLAAALAIIVVITLWSAALEWWKLRRRSQA